MDGGHAQQIPAVWNAQRIKLHVAADSKLNEDDRCTHSSLLVLKENMLTKPRPRFVSFPFLFRSRSLAIHFGRGVGSRWAERAALGFKRVLRRSMGVTDDERVERTCRPPREESTSRGRSKCRWGIKCLER